MWEHYLIDNPPPVTAGTRDDDYEREYNEVDEPVEPTVPGDEIRDREHRLPIQEHESYHDPEFDKAWNEDEEIDEDMVVNNSDIPLPDEFEEV